MGQGHVGPLTLGPRWACLDLRLRNRTAQIGPLSGGSPSQQNALPRHRSPLACLPPSPQKSPSIGQTQPAQGPLSGSSLQHRCVNAAACINTVRLLLVCTCFMAHVQQYLADASSRYRPKGLVDCLANQTHPFHLSYKLTDWGVFGCACPRTHTRIKESIPYQQAPVKRSTLNKFLQRCARVPALEMQSPARDWSKILKRHSHPLPRKRDDLACDAGRRHLKGKRSRAWLMTSGSGT